MANPNIMARRIGLPVAVLAAGAFVLTHQGNADGAPIMKEATTVTLESGSISAGANLREQAFRNEEADSGDSNRCATTEQTISFGRLTVEKVISDGNGSWYGFSADSLPTELAADCGDTVWVSSHNIDAEQVPTN